MKSQSSAVLKSIIAPDNIVVIGASTDTSKPGGSVTKKIIDGNYRGILRAVNPKTPSVMGLPTFATIDEVPLGIDLAIIAIPGKFVRQSLLDLSKKETKAVMILTAGFGEVDEKGKEEERRFLEIANANGMTIVGPNCVGIITPHYCGKFAGIIPELKSGSVDLISASGATVDYMMEQAEVLGLKFSNVISLGNSIQQGVEDFLALLDENFNDDSSKIIMIYMESIKKPQLLLKHSRSLTNKGCTVIGIKSGVTSAGERAAASHTGAMTTSDTAVQALFDKAGIIRVQSKREMIEVGCALELIGHKTKSNRVAIVTDAGGPGVMLSDELNRQGLEVPLMKEQTQEKLLRHLPPQSSVLNPIDCLPSQTAEQTKAVFKILEEEEDLDAIVIITGNSMLFDKWDTYKEIVDGMDNCSVPIVPVLSSIMTCVDLLDRVKSYGKTYFYDEIAAGHALGKIRNRPQLSEFSSTDGLIKGYDTQKTKQRLEISSGILNSIECRNVLNAIGIKTPPQIEVFQRNELPEACGRIGFPVVIKVIGPLHKSDVGGVRVGIQTLKEAQLVWDKMMKIDGAQGVLLQEMIDGLEIIAGISKESNFGHLIMFGLGGIYTEVLKDVSFKLCPVSKDEAMKMIREIRSFKLLEGVRGEKGVSLDVLADYLVKLSKLAYEFPQINEIDLNPIKGIGNNLYAVDCRMLIDSVD